MSLLQFIFIIILLLLIEKLVIITALPPFKKLTITILNFTLAIDL